MKTVILIVSLLANVFLGVLLLVNSGSEQDHIDCLERKVALLVQGDTAGANSFMCGDTV